ncbi:MAG: lipid A export permease/ATP-binding protein MsbA [Gammaproteobacteria bacterium]|nr:lipid A export permease/ATP-binding protein MsbA [Gammaproteobacteria bacterium]MDH5801304.1 lipid A export permease/ATP-binding protein MsbA [Gammaproteobacteria bacterium]
MAQAGNQDAASAVYKRLLRFTRPYLGGFMVAVFGMTLVAATETGFAAMMEPLLDGTFIHKDPKVIKYLPGALLLLFLIRGVGAFLTRFYMEWVGRNVIRDLRRLIFEHLLRLPSRFFDTHNKGQLTSKLIYDVEQVAGATTNALTVLIRDTLTVLGLLIWMIIISWQLTLFYLVVTPVIGGLVVYVSKRFRRISRKIQTSMGSVSQVSQQVIEGQRVVKVYGAEEYEKRVFEQANEFNRRQFMKMAITSGLNVPISQFFAALALACVVYFVTKETTITTPGVFMSFVSASLLLLPPMKRLTQVTENIQRGVAAAQSLFELLDTQAEIDTGTLSLDKPRGEVEFRNIGFSYDRDREQQVLKGVSLKVSAGQTVAFVGRSGSGKSTLVSLLPRFYDPQQGEILLDGIPLGELRLSNLRQHIALVSQDVTLFNDTVANNIAYGCQDTDREHIVKAATAAHAMEFIQELPQGLDTLITEQGSLSGGQRQRVAIARALLKDAPILILDEATSALDNESERIIQDALEILMQGRTTFVIAHRLSTVENADLIVVMNEGRIVEQGKHAELLALSGTYAALHTMQFTENPE